MTGTQPRIADIVPLPLCIHRPDASFLDPHLGLETKYPVCPTRIQAPSWLTVGFCCIPHDPPRKASQVGDHFYQFLDTNLLAATQIHWLAIVIVLCSEEDTLGSVLHVEEFPCGRPIAPHFDGIITAGFCVDTFLY